MILSDSACLHISRFSLSVRLTNIQSLLPFVVLAVLALFTMDLDHIICVVLFLGAIDPNRVVLCIVILYFSVVSHYQCCQFSD